MDIKRVPISEVEAWEKNPRNIKTKDFERLKRQIQELGVYKPLICVQENGKYVTLGGNMRLKALEALNLSEVDISIVEAKDEATRIKYALSDNDRAGEYDEQALAELTYPHIEEINLEDFKLDIGQPISLKDVIEDYAPDVEGEDEIPEIDDSPAITKMGDLFTLGRHRLLCGDATKEEDVKRLMNGEKADMVFTDPPYNIEANIEGKSFGTSGKKAYTKQNPLFSDWIPLMAKYGKESMSILVFEFWTNIINLWKEMERFFEIKNLIIWHATNRHWAWSHKHFYNRFDVCLFAIRGNYIFYKKLASIATDVITSPVSNKYESGQNIVGGVKPVKILVPYIRVLSKTDSLILEPFCGSGSMLIACEKLNRICYGMEIEPKYCDVIITRYSNFTDIPEEEIRAMRENLN